MAYNSLVIHYILVKMFNALKNLFSKDAQQQAKEQLYLEQHNIQFDDQKGYIVDGIVVNELSERLEYFSNRRLKSFDDLQALYFAAMLINEKIDLEIATGQYVARLGNTQENLIQLKNIIQKLNQYYREFKRER